MFPACRFEAITCSRTGAPRSSKTIQCLENDALQLELAPALAKVIVEAADGEQSVSASGTPGKLGMCRQQRSGLSRASGSG